MEALTGYEYSGTFSRREYIFVGKTYWLRNHYIQMIQAFMRRKSHQDFNLLSVAFFSGIDGK
jgi:hypothetical protein